MLEPLLASLLVSLASLVGVILLRADRSTIIYLVSFATGTFLGGFFFHVLPKVSPLGEISFTLVFLSFIGFALLEKLFHFHEHFRERSLGIVNLVGDFFHNFLDGLGMAGAFRMGSPFGWVFTFMVLAHEVPQEIGDYAILLLSGFERRRALLLNLLVALTSVLGVVVGWYVKVDPRVLVAIVGGSFLYIGASDLVPLLKEEIKEKRSLLISLLLFALGVSLMWALKHLR